MGAGSIAVPYRLNGGAPTDFTTWASPKLFQILAAGADDLHGTAPPASGKQFPAGIGYDPGGADEDNLVSFAKFRLSKMRP
jgi:hypothetical protein